MVKKICPICDQVMKSSHFCRNCRSWIKHPYEHDVNFYLNERHPADEARCEYHGVSQPRSAGHASQAEIYADVDLNRQVHRKIAKAGSQAAGTASGPGGSGSRIQSGRPGGSGSRMPVGGSGSGGSRMPVGGSGSTGNGPQVTAKLVKSGKGAYIIVAVAIGIVLLIAIGTAVMGGIYNTVSENLSSSFQYDDYGDFEEWSDENYRELEDEEVKAAGARCNAYYHFLVKEEELAPAVSEAILSAGYKIASETTYSYNEATLDGEDEWTNYSTTHTIYVAGDGMTIRDDLSQWVEMNSDTATGELHYYSSQLADKVKSLIIMTEFVKGIESNYGVKTEESSVPQITRDMQTELDASGSYSYESNLFYISAQMYSDGLYLEVSCNRED